MKRYLMYVAFLGALTGGALSASAFTARGAGSSGPTPSGVPRSCIVTIKGGVSFPTDDCSTWQGDPDVISCVCTDDR